MNDKKRVNFDNETQQFINFIEEFCWLLDSNKELNFKDMSKFLKMWRTSLLHLPYKNDAYELIGVLPSLLKDNDIFQNNSQLVQFAQEVLAMNIPRWEKRSRNEIIGLIICEVEDVNKERLKLLTQWTLDIISNKKQVKDMQYKAKKAGSLFSWNETIQRLSGGDNE